MKKKTGGFWGGGAPPATPKAIIGNRKGDSIRTAALLTRLSFWKLLVRKAFL